MANLDSPVDSDYRIVLLGKDGAEKSRIIRAIFGGKVHMDESGQCIFCSGRAAGRSVFVVEAPGWNRISIQETSKKTKNEIKRSVIHCSPGPHALILVLPVNHGELPSANERKSIIQHMELLSERVWSHTIVLFLCDEDVDEATISTNIQNAGKLLEKCRGRHFVLRSKNLETQTSELLKVIDNMVEENSGACFLPPVLCNIQSKSPKDKTEMRKMYEDREEYLQQASSKKTSDYKKEAQKKETEPRLRRQSMDTPGGFNKEEAQPSNSAEIKRTFSP